MRFKDGMWLPIGDKHVNYAEEIHAITESPDKKKLSLLCPTSKQFSRGDSLNRPTLTLDIEAVADGIISLETTHWHGAARRGPNFELFPDEKPSTFESSITKTDAGTTISAGSMAATVSAEPHTFDIRFHTTNGSRELTSLLERSVAFAYSQPPGSLMETEDMRNFKHYIMTQSSLGVGEQVFGLGERFGAWNKVGQTVSLWNADGGTSSDQAYKNVSFWLSNKGYGVFIDTPERVELEIGSERCCRVQTSVESQRLKWYIIYGPSPKEVISRYTLLTGRATRVPTWSFGLWLTTSFTTSYDDATITHFLQGMRDRDIPLEVFHYDAFWMRGFHWTDFAFDPTHFPDPATQIATLKQSRLTGKTCVWLNPYIAQASALFPEAAEKGYLLLRANGRDIWQWDLWQSGMALVDFTNPAACTWYQSKLNTLFDLGVDAIKTDFGERVPVSDVRWHDPTVDPNRMHNYYAHLYNATVFAALQSRFGPDGQAVVFARAACAGTQRFPLQWGGDCESTFEAMAESLRGGLSLGVCGFSFWSVDIGGFEGRPDPALYKRWVQFGLLCSHSRLHGSNTYRVPWLIDDDAEGPESATGVLRQMVRLKARLMPYLMAEAAEAVAHGWPLSVRAMALEFPEDPTAWFVDTQFMLGSRILVAPVFTADGEVTVYFPAGRWTYWFDEEKVVEGPRWVTERHGFDSLPIYVREGTVLVLGREEESRTVYPWEKAGERVVKMFFPTEDYEARVVDSNGKKCATVGAVEREGKWEVVEKEEEKK